MLSAGFAFAQAPGSAPVISANVTSPTNSEGILYTVQFGGMVSDFSTGDIVITANGTLVDEPHLTMVNVTTYTFEVSHGIDEGAVTVLIRGGTTTVGGIASAESELHEITIDRIAPVANEIFVSGSSTIRLVMSEPVSEAGNAVGNFRVSGIASEADVDFISVSDNTIELTVDGEILDTDDPTVAYTTQFGSINDAATNPLAHINRTVTNDRDTTGPMPTVSNGNINLTKQSTIPFTVQFDEPVDDFNATDIAVFGSAEVDESSFEMVNTTDYAFNMVHKSDGQVHVLIPSGAVHDEDGNDSLTSNTVVFIFDITQPTVTGGTVPDSDTIILELSEPILDNGTVNADFTVSGVGANIEVLDILFGTDTITLNLNGNITDDDAPQVSYAASTGTIHDPATNRLANFDNSPIFNGIDGTRPIPTLAVGQITPEGASFIVTFDEPVSGFNSTGITVTGSDTTIVTEPVEDGTDTFTFNVLHGGSSGPVTVSISEGAARDIKGNESEESNRITVFIGTDLLGTTLSTDEGSPTNSETISYNVVFGHEVIFFGPNNIDVLIDGEPLDKAGISVQGSDPVTRVNTNASTVFTFEVTHGTNNGTVTVSISNGTVTDAQGTPNTESNKLVHTVDRVPPAVFDSYEQNSTTIRLEMSEPVFDRSAAANDFAISGVVSEPTVESITVSGRIVDLHLSKIIIDTDSPTVAYTRTDGSIEDLATNRLGNFEDLLISDGASPITTLSTTSANFTNSRTIPFTVQFDEPVTGFNRTGITVTGSATAEIDAFNDNGDDSYTFNVVASTDGELTVQIPAGAATDHAGNESVASDEITVTIDTLSPTLEITADVESPTNSAKITYTVRFSESVNGFDEGDIAVTGSENDPAGFVEVNSTAYTFDVTHGMDTGTITVSVEAGATMDNATNPNTVSSLHTITIDRIPPEVDSASVLDTDTITLVISEPVSGGVASDFTISGVATNPTVSSIIIDGSTITLDLNGLITDADSPTVSYTETDGIEDPVENRLANFVNEPVANNLDTTRPTVTAFTTTSSNPTNSQTITYNVQFSEPVTRFNATGIGVSGTSGGTAAEPTGSERDYEFVVTRGASDGTVTVTILEGAARDADDNLSLASTPVEIAIDATPPTVTDASVSDTDTIILEISEPVSGGAASDFTINGVASGPSVASIDITGSTVTLDLNDLITDADNPAVSYTGTVDIEDAAENPLADFANEPVTNDIDTTRPTVTSFTTTSSNPTNSQTITYAVQFSEPVTRFNATGIDVSGTSGGTAAEPTGSERDYEFVVTRGASDGTVTVTILEGAARDADDNLSLASSPVEIAVDATPPTVTGASVFDTDTIVLTISEPLDESGGAASDFTISGVASTSSVSSINIAGSTITLNLDDSITDADNPTISYTETGGIEDLAENRLANFADQIATNDLDTTRPVPTLTITSEPGSTHTNSPTVSYMVEFDMDVVGFIEGDIMVEGLANNGNPETSNFVTVDDATYTFDVERDGSDGNVIVSIPENRATDLAGNQNIASSRLEITFDTIPPTATLASTESGDTKLRTIPINATFGERVDDFGIDDIIIEGAATADAPTTNDNILYMFDVVATADGDVTVSIREDAVRDMADNGNTASETIAFAVDTVAPTVTITSDVGPLTNLEHILYEVEFDGPVLGIDENAIMVDGSTNNTASFTGSGDTYTFNVTHGISAGPITVSVRAGAAQDAAGNNSTASNQIKTTIDRIAPVADKIFVSGSNTIRLVMSEPIFEDGNAVGNFRVSGIASEADVDFISVSGITIDLTVDGEILDTDDPTVAYTTRFGSINDAATNPLAHINRTVTNDRDTTGPMPTVSNGGINLTKQSTIPFTVQFDEPVDDFNATDIAVFGSAEVDESSFEMVNVTDYAFNMVHKSDGQVHVLIPSGAVHDEDGNDSLTSNTVVFIFDITQPTVTGGTVPDSDTIILELSEPILDNGTMNTDFAVSGVDANILVLDILFGTDTITLNLNGNITDDDAPQVSYAASTGTIHDPATNRLENFDDSPIFNGIDGTRPIPTLAVGQIMPEGASFIVTFDEPVSGFNSTGITVTGSDTAIVTEPVEDGTDTFTFNVLHGGSSGPVTVLISEGAARDIKGNESEESNRITVFIGTDLLGTTLSTDEGSPTNSETISYNVVFGHEVIFFGPNNIDVLIDGEPLDKAGISVQGSDPVTRVNTNASTVFTFEVTHGTDNGTVTVSISEGAVTDAQGTPNTASSELVHVVDRVPPVVFDGHLENRTTIRLEMSEPVLDNSTTAVDFTVTKVATNPMVESITVSGRIVDLHLTGAIEDDDSPTVSYTRTTGSIEDPATNRLANFPDLLISDGASPITTLSTASANFTNSRTIPFTVTFDEPVIGFNRTGVVVTGDAAVENFIDNDGSFTFDVVASTDGNVTVSIPKGAATDYVGNPSEASETIARTIDTIPPTLEITADVTSPTNSAEITYTVGFSESVTGFDEEDITVADSTARPAGFVEVNSTAYTFDVTHGIDTGTVTVSVRANAAMDNATNPNTVSSLHTITIDRIPPEVDSASVLDARTVRLVMSEPVSETGDPSFDFTVFGISSGGQVESVEVSGSMIDITVNRNMVETDSLTVTYAAQFGSINDMATNPLADFEDEPVTNDIDNTPPRIISFETTSSNFTNSQTVTYTVEFSESVTGFDISGISVTGTSGATATIPEGDGASYTFDVNRGDTDGTVTASILAGAARDDAGNPSEASDPVTVTIDTIPPVVDTASVLDATTIRLVMSEPVIDDGDLSFDFTVFGISTGGQVESVEVSGSMIDITVNRNIVETDSLTVTYVARFGSINDTATNPLADFEDEPVTNDIDNTAPVPTVSNGNIDLTNREIIPFTVRFDEPVTGFNATGIKVSESAGVQEHTFVPANATVYNFNIQAAEDGEVTVSILAGAARDGQGNPSVASNQVRFTIDTTPPTVTGGSVPGSNIITLDMSEPVFDRSAAADDFAISGVSSGPSVASIAVSGSTITLNLNNAVTDGDSPTVSYAASSGAIEDLATNRLADFEDEPVTNDIDNTAPVPTISSDESGITQFRNIPFTVTFDESVTGFNATGIKVSGSASVANFDDNNDDSYRFNLVADTDGELTVQIPAGAATDHAGNENTASEVFSIIVDTVPPTLEITADVESPTNSAEITYTVRFSESVNGFDEGDIAVTGSENDPAGFVRVNSTAYTFDVTHGIGTGTVTVSVEAGAATDDAGYVTARGQLAHIVDRIPPEVDSASVLDARTVRLVMSEGIVDSESVPFNFRVSGIATDPDPLSATFGDNTIDLAFEIDIEDDDVLELSYTRTTGSINDTATNILADFSGVTVTNDLDTTPPTPTVSNGDISLTNQLSLPFTVRFDESVTGLAEDEITVNGPARVVPGSFAPVNTTHYNFDVERVDSDGEITVFLAQGAAIDDDQNLSTTSNVVVFTIDTVAPAVTGDSIPDSNTIVLETSEPVTGGVASEFVLSGITPALTVNTIVVSDNTITLNLSDSIPDGGSLTVTYVESDGTVTDPAENPLAGFTRAISNEADDTSPTIISFTTTSSNPTRVSTITYDVVFSEPVTFDSVSGISVTGTSGAAANTPTGSGASHTFTVTRGTTDGTVIVSLSEGAARDDAGNPSEASDEITITIDTQRPVPTISANATGLTNSAAIQYTVDFGEDVDEFVASDIGVSARGISLAVPSIVEVSAGVYDFTISHGINEGNVTAQVLPFIATDAAGNSNIESSLHEITIDRIAPTVTGASVSDTDTIILEISEPVSGGAASDFTINGVATNPSVSSIVITGSTVTLELNGLITDADTPLISYTGTADSIEDLATNPLAAFTDHTVENEIDTTRPSVTDFTTTSSNPTNSQTITYTVQFSESVTGFSAAGIGVTGTSGGTVAEPTGTGRDYEFVVTRGVSDGIVTVTILENAARDTDDNLSFASSPVEITVDATPPTVTGAEVVNPNIIRLDLSEPVSDDGATASDFTIAGTASNHVVSSLSVSGSTVELSLAPSLTDADNPTVSYARTAGEIEDPATNRLANFAGFTVTNEIDTTRPSVTSFGTGSPNPTNSQTITYTVQFSESVTGFSAAGIGVTGTSGGTVAEPTGTGRDYEFVVTRGVSDGIVTVTILEGAARDTDDNLSFSSSPVEIMTDATPPTVIAASVSDTDTIILEISESVSGGAASDFTISGVATNPSVSSIVITGSTVTLELNGLITDADNPAVSYTGTAGSIEDLATNPLAAFTDHTVENEIDTTRPTITIFETTLPEHTNSTSITFTVRFSESVTGFDDASDVTITGTSGGTVNAPTGSGAEYTFTVNRGSTDGTITVLIPEDAARDDAGNPNTASGSVTRTIDTIPPTVTISADAQSPTNLGTIQYEASFDETITGVSFDDIVLEGSSETTVIFGGSGVTYTYGVSHDITEGELTASVRAGAATDLAGNTNAASVPLVLTVDRVPPEVDSASVLDARTVRLVMSEGIVDSESVPFNFRVSGIATDPDPLSATFGDNTIDLAFEIDIEDDDVLVLSYARTTGSINDTATNILADFSGFTVTNELDTTPPTPTVSNGDISLTNQSPLPFTVRFDESVTGLAEDEITVNGPARVVPGSLVTDDNVDYTFDVERVDSDGEITVFIAHGAAVDDDQNLSTTSNVVVFTFDITPPTVTGDSIPDSNTIVLEISEDVTGGNEADFTISGVTL